MVSVGKERSLFENRLRPLHSLAPSELGLYSSDEPQSA